MTKWLNWQPNTETELKKGGMEVQDLNGEFVSLFVLLVLFVCFSEMAELAAKYRDSS